VEVGGVVEPIERPIVDARLFVGRCRDRLVRQEIEVGVRAEFADPCPTLDPIGCAVGDDCMLPHAKQGLHQGKPVA